MRNADLASSRPDDWVALSAEDRAILALYVRMAEGRRLQLGG